jgi:hypothetical protein
VKQMQRDITHLTEESEESDIVNRPSFSEGARAAVTRIKEQVEASECGAACEF